MQRSGARSGAAGQARARWNPLPFLGCALLGLGVIGSLGLLLGARLEWQLLGWYPLRSVAGLWSQTLGWAALPVGIALALAGLLLLGRAEVDPLRLPWVRVLGAEMVLLALLALIGLARGPAPLEPSGPEGRLGWALASATREALGGLPAWLTWLAILLLGLAASLRIGARQLAAGLEQLAEALAVEPPPAPGPDTIAPDSKARVPAAASAAGGQDRRAARQVEGSDARDARPTKRAGASEARSEGQRSGQAPMPAATEPAAPMPAAESKRRGPPPVRDLGRSKPGGRKPPRRNRQLPDIELFEETQQAGAEVDDATLQDMGRRIEESLASFGVPVEVVDIERGPTVTRFGLKPGFVTRGDRRLRIKVSRITALRQDLALALAAPTLRIEAPIPGRSMVGVEVPNPSSSQVRLRAVLEDPSFRDIAKQGGLPVAMGREVTGQTVVADLARMPHLLVAGATGSGKSVFLNGLLASLLFQHNPDALRLVLIDPKRVELHRFGGLPHLISDPVTDPAEAVGALRWAAAEMDRRYRSFAERGARDRAGFNAKSPAGEAPVPALVVVIDELADLMMTAPGEVEPLLTRLAQMGRATGIHLVLATQRPSIDVITGLIKANCPARVAFAVASAIDSRVIIDQTGAEGLLGRGDMLFQPPDGPHLRRIQGAWVEDDELDRLIDFWKASHWQGPGRLPPWEGLELADDPDAEIYAEAQRIALDSPRVSASLLQRKLRIGYDRARKLYQRLEEEGMTDDKTDSQGFDWVDDEFEG